MRVKYAGLQQAKQSSLKLEQPTMSYFSTEVFEGEMAHARFYEDEIRTKMPKCSYRKYTISEIINSVIRCVNNGVFPDFEI